MVSTKSTGPLALLKDDQASCSLNGSNACFSVKGQQGSQVNDLNLDVFFRKQVRCLKGDVDHGPPK